MATTVQTAPTLGWDTVFATPIARVNAAIAKAKSSPTQFETHYSASGDPFGITAEIDFQATFDDWMVIPGGDGGLIQLKLPLANLVGSGTLNGQPFQLSIAQLHAIVEVQLTYLEHAADGSPLINSNGQPYPPPAPGTTRNKLVVLNASTAPAGGTASTSAELFATMVGVFFDPSVTPPSRQAKNALELAIGDWCNAHLSDFEHVFAVVDLNDQIATGQFAFCKPRVTSYAFIDDGTFDGSVLGVLCMTSADPPPTEQQVCNAAIPAGSESAFLIGSHRLLLDLLKPSFLELWPNLKPEQLVLATDGKSLQLAEHVTVDLPPVTPSGSSTSYTPSLQSFSVTLDVNELTVQSYTEVEIESGVYATCAATLWYTIGLTTTSSGKQTLTFSQSQTPSIHHGTRSTSNAELTEKILEIAGVVLGILAMVLTDGASLIVSALLIGLLVGQYIDHQIVRDHMDDAPAVDLLVMNATQPIQWPDSTTFRLNFAGLNDSLQLGGTWNAAALR